MGLIDQLSDLGIKIHLDEIQPVDDFEGEIGKSFKVLRRLSASVSRAKKANSFPLVLSGNCMATVGVACGLGIKDPGFIYFDAYDDMDTPSTNINGYFDAMGLSMLAGKSWHTLTENIPGFSPTSYNKFLYCGLRDVDFAAKLQHHLEKENYSPALVHLGLDVLDEPVGKVNGFESAGGLQESDLVDCLALVPKKAEPVSLTVCSFNPNLGDGDKIARIAIQTVVAFVTSMIDSGVIAPRVAAT